MIYLLEHGVGLGLLAAAVWLAGYAVESRWLQISQGALPADRGLRPLARIALGLVSWISVLFVLAALGALRLLPLALVAGIAAAAALLAFQRRRGSPADERGSGRRRRRPDRLMILVAAALAAVLVPLYLLALTPTVSWDAGAYHLTVPKLWVAAAGFREVPFNVYSNWPLATELLFAAAMLVGDFVLAKLVHFAFGALTLYAVYAGCRRFCRPGRRGQTSGWIAMALFLANGVVLYEIRVAYVDLAHAFFFAAGFLFLMRALKPVEDRGPDPGADRALLLAGLCAGAVAAIKLNGIAGAAILGSLYLPRLAAAARAGEVAASVRRFGAWFVVPVLAFWVPWLIKSAAATGNPFYPLLLGGAYWSPRLGEQLHAWQSSIGMGREPLDYLLLPLRVILDGGAGYARFDGEVGAFWIVVLPLAGWVARRHALVRRCLAAAGLYFVFWALSSQQMRLLIPVLPLLSIAGGVAAVELLERLPWPDFRPLGRRLLLLGSLAILVWTAAGGQLPGGTAKPTRGRYLFAAASALERYLNEEGDLRQTAVHPVYGFLRTLPADARLLFLNTNQGFFCDREFFADSFFEASQIADWLRPAATVAALRERLAAAGVTHLLIAHRDWGIAYPPALPAMLDDPQQAALLYRSPDGRYSVVEVR